MRSCLALRAMATFPPCSSVMLVVARGDEGGGREPVQQLGQLLQGCGGRGPSRRLVLEPLPLGEPLGSRLGILLGGQLGDEPGADVLADDAAVHFAAAGVVAAAVRGGSPSPSCCVTSRCVPRSDCQ